MPTTRHPRTGRFGTPRYSSPGRGRRGRPPLGSRSGRGSRPRGSTVRRPRTRCRRPSSRCTGRGCTVRYSTGRRSRTRCRPLGSRCTGHGCTARYSTPGPGRRPYRRPDIHCTGCGCRVHYSSPGRGRRGRPPLGAAVAAVADPGQHCSSASHAVPETKQPLHWLWMHSPLHPFVGTAGGTDDRAAHLQATTTAVLLFCSCFVSIVLVVAACGCAAGCGLAPDRWDARDASSSLRVLSTPPSGRAATSRTSQRRVPRWAKFTARASKADGSCSSPTLGCSWSSYSRADHAVRKGVRGPDKHGGITTLLAATARGPAADIAAASGASRADQRSRQAEANAGEENSLLKNSSGAASEPFRDHMRHHFTAESCSMLGTGNAGHTLFGKSVRFSQRSRNRRGREA